MILKFNKKLAELVGIILGDGSFFIGKGVSELDIAFNAVERDYIDYVKSLIMSLTGFEPREKLQIENHCIHLRVSRKLIVEALLFASIKKSGNKIKNQVTIPSWIMGNNLYLRYCLRGLIDTDGSVFKMSKKDPNLYRISFKNKNKKLLQDVRNSFIKLGFHPSCITCNQIFLSRKAEIKRYYDEIGFSNAKNIYRLKI